MRKASVLLRGTWCSQMRSQTGAVLCRFLIFQKLVRNKYPAATRASVEAGRTSARVRGVAWVTRNITPWLSILLKKRLQFLVIGT